MQTPIASASQVAECRRPPDPTDEEDAERDEEHSADLRGRRRLARSTIPPSRTSTGADPRAIGYTKDSSARPYAVVSKAKYVSCSSDVTTRKGHTSRSASQASAATGANATTPTTSATAVVASMSGARARRMFQNA